MQNLKRFPFIERRNGKGEANVFPCMPITLSYGDRTLEIFGLLDTGASFNVLILMKSDSRLQAKQQSAVIAAHLCSEL